MKMPRQLPGHGAECFFLVEREARRWRALLAHCTSLTVIIIIVVIITVVLINVVIINHS